jgi:hypothetical protein
MLSDVIVDLYCDVHTLTRLDSADREEGGVSSSKSLARHLEYCSSFNRDILLHCDRFTAPANAGGADTRNFCLQRLSQLGQFKRARRMSRDLVYVLVDGCDQVNNN